MPHGYAAKCHFFLDKGYSRAYYQRERFLRGPREPTRRECSHAGDSARKATGLIRLKGGSVDIERKVTYEERLDPGFLDDIKRASGCEEIDGCIQCGTCSSSCPMSVYMDFPPRKVIALVKSGFKDEALRNFTIWLCPSCYTCQVRCPAQIKITDVMYALKRTAIEEKVYPSRFVIPILDREMSRLIAKHGRNSELWLILNLYLKSRNPLGLLKMAPMGLKLLKTGRMSLKRESIRDTKQLRALVSAVKEGRR
jgi:heterodisulfide reductase subunit C